MTRLLLIASVLLVASVCCAQDAPEAKYYAEVGVVVTVPNRLVESVWKALHVSSLDGIAVTTKMRNNPPDAQTKMIPVVVMYRTKSPITASDSARATDAAVALLSKLAADPPTIYITLSPKPWPIP